MSLDLKPVADFIRRAQTEDLLDRVTVFRESMEPAAVDLMENELWRRGITPEQVAEHADWRGEVLRRADGSAVRCASCYRPAVSRHWGWHKRATRHWLLGWWSVLPNFLPRCEEHGG